MQTFSHIMLARFLIFLKGQPFLNTFVYNTYIKDDEKYFNFNFFS